MSDDRTSSLRMRIDRVRAGFDRRVDLAKLCFGIVLVGFTAIGLYLAFWT